MYQWGINDQQYQLLQLKSKKFPVVHRHKSGKIHLWPSWSYFFPPFNFRCWARACTIFGIHTWWLRLHNRQCFANLLGTFHTWSWNPDFITNECVCKVFRKAKYMVNPSSAVEPDRHASLLTPSGSGRPFSTIWDPWKATNVTKSI